MKYSFLHYSLLDVNSNPINLSIHVHCTVQMYGSQHQRRPNAAHRRWQRSILRSILAISWNYRVTNEAVRVRTGQHTMDDILAE